MIINVKFQEEDKRIEAALAQNDSTVQTNFGEFQKVPATANHSDLLERELDNQHPISAITGLQKELDGKQPKGDYLTKESDPTVPAWAKQANKPTYTAKEVGAIPKEDAQSIVDTALEQAKASGEFDGKDGKDGVDGKDGYTPIKNKDYFDGYTPQKGVDYFDGQNGADGKDGVSVSHAWSGTTLFVTSASGTTSADLKGKDGANGKDGSNGKDGIDGKDGVNGKDGADGKTPVKGIDYFTDSDKTEIANAVLAMIPIYDGEVIAE